MIDRRMRALVTAAVMVLCAVSGCSDDTETPVEPNGTGGTGIWYVNAQATGPYDGTSWNRAFQHPQDALDTAAPGDTVWVASGTYTSTDPGERHIPVLTLKAGVALYGGFSPGDTALADRDFRMRETILDGDGAVYHVVIGADEARIDGFTITGGRATYTFPDDVGGGVRNIDVSLTIANCTFNDNISSWHGAGIFNMNSSALIANCTFTDNTAGYNGGGIYNDSEVHPGRYPTIIDCTFINNMNSRFGSGIYNYHCRAEIIECIFDNNYANHNGGGIYNYSSSATIRGCLFMRNTSLSGAGLYVNLSEGAQIENCIFLGNSAAESGGGLYLLNASPLVSNCTFNGNLARYGGAISNWNSTAAITGCILWGNAGSLVDEEIEIGASAVPSISFCDIDQDGYGLIPGGEPDASGNMRLDPLFTTGPHGQFYLSQTGAGQLEESPCVDAGGNTSAFYGLTGRTTRSDGFPDTGTVDIGFHYPLD